MPWVYLVIAGLLEAGWAIGLKYTQGFTKPIPSILTGLGIVISFWLLARAAQTIPIGTAYVVWVGIGGLGAAVLGMILLNEPISLMRIVFLGLMFVSIVGLKLSAG